MREFRCDSEEGLEITQLYHRLIEHSNTWLKVQHNLVSYNIIASLKALVFISRTKPTLARVKQVIHIK